MSQIYSIAQIGTAHDHACNIIWTLKNSSRFDLVGYCHVDNTRTAFEENKRFYEGVKELSLEEIFNIPNLKAVAIETTEQNLIKYATMAVKRGLHVYIDKPGNESLEDFIDINTFSINSSYKILSSEKTVTTPVQSRYMDLMDEFYYIISNKKEQEFTKAYERELFKTVLKASGLI